MAKIVDSLRAGDRVTIVDRFGQKRTGRAVMKGPHGWVLNMGGRHGTPAIASDENIVKVSPTKGGKRGPLGGTKAQHTAAATKASEQIEHTAAHVVNQVRNGKCTQALLGYADMQRAIGEYEAHTKFSGTVYKPTTSIRDAAYEFSMKCVREAPGLDGRRKRKG